MQSFVGLLDALTDARVRCCAGSDSNQVVSEAVAIAERAVALIEDWNSSDQAVGVEEKDKETIALLESLARNTIFEFGPSSSSSSLLSPSSSSAVLSSLPSPPISRTLQELVDAVNSDYQQQRQQQILSGLYRVQGKSGLSSFSTTSDGRQRLARSSSSFSSASLSTGAAGAAAIPPGQRPGLSSKAFGDGNDHELTRAQSSDFDESLHIGANKIVSDSVEPSDTTKHTLGKPSNAETTTMMMIAANNQSSQMNGNEDGYEENVCINENGINDEDDAMMCFTQIPVPEFPKASTDEEAERTVMSTLETHPSVAVCEALVRQVLADRVLALSGDIPPTRSLCASLFAVYDAYPSVLMDVVLGPMIKRGLSNAQSNVLGKFVVHAKLSPGVITWLAECLRASPSGASELAVGLFQSFVGLPEWSQLGPSELYAVAKWLQQAEPTLRKSLKFSSFLLALLKKHARSGVSDTQTQASSQGKKGNYSQGNEEYMSILRELAKTNESMLKRTLIKFCN